MLMGRCQPSQGNGQAYRDELDRVLSSACFARSERVSKLLRFLVERQLEGRENELKESVIGVEVFGRRPDYNPKLDSTVRTEAVRLRARLASVLFDTREVRIRWSSNSRRAATFPLSGYPAHLRDHLAARPALRINTESR